MIKPNRLAPETLRPHTRGSPNNRASERQTCGDCLRRCQRANDDEARAQYCYLAENYRACARAELAREEQQYLQTVRAMSAGRPYPRVLLLFIKLDQQRTKFVRRFLRYLELSPEFSTHVCLNDVVMAISG